MPRDDAPPDGCAHGVIAQCPAKYRPDPAREQSAKPPARVCPVCYRERFEFVQMVEGRCPKIGEHGAEKS